MSLIVFYEEPFLYLTIVIGLNNLILLATRCFNNREAYFLNIGALGQGTSGCGWHTTISQLLFQVLLGKPTPRTILNLLLILQIHFFQLDTLWLTPNSLYF